MAGIVPSADVADAPDRRRLVRLAPRPGAREGRPRSQLHRRPRRLRRHRGARSATTASCRTTRWSTSRPCSRTASSSARPPCFTNDHYPRAINPDGTPQERRTTGSRSASPCREGASIGARAVCVAPVTIGRWALVAAGSVVIKDVPDFALVAGVPARRIRWVGQAGVPLEAPATEHLPVRCARKTGGETLPSRHDDTLTEDPISDDFIPAAKPIIGDEERAAVDRVLRSGMLAQGPEVTAFEEEFSQHFGLRPRLRRGQLRHLRPAPRPALVRASAPATRSSSRRSPSPRPPTRSRSPAPRRSSPTSSPTTSASTRPRSRPRSPSAPWAIMPVHLYGHPANMTALREIADRHGLADLRGRRAGARRLAARHARSAPSATFAMFSLYPTKNMTSGEGGMVSCADDEIERLTAALPQPGHGAAVPQRGRRLQQPHDRHPRRHRPGAADQGRRLDRAAPGERGLPRRPTCEGVVDAPGRRRAPCTSTTSTRSGSPDDRDGFAAALREEYDVGSRHVLPGAEPPPAAVPGRRSTCPRPSRPRASACRCRCTRRCRQADLERIVDAVNALAGAGA